MSEIYSQKQEESSRGEERKQSLVVAAYQTIAERGFEGLRTREVAERVGINIATLHYHFPTKEALIQAVLEYLLHQFITVIPTRPERPETSSIVSQLQNEFADMAYQLKQEPQIFIVLLEISLRSLRNPTLLSAMQRFEAHWYKHLHQLLEEGVQQGELSPDLNSHQEASQLVALLTGLSFQSVHGFDRPNIEEIGVEYLRRIASTKQETIDDERNT